MIESTPITFYDFVTKKEEIIPIVAKDGITGGHGGGDAGIIADLYQYFCGEYSGFSIPTIEESLYNHLLVFAAEESRRTNSVINVNDYIKNQMK